MEPKQLSSTRKKGGGLFMRSSVIVLQNKIWSYFISKKWAEVNKSRITFGELSFFLKDQQSTPIYALPLKKKTPTRQDPWQIRDLQLTHWFHNIYDEIAFPCSLFFFVSFSISFHFLFLISVFWFSCLGFLFCQDNSLCYINSL